MITKGNSKAAKYPFKAVLRTSFGAFQVEVLNSQSQNKVLARFFGRFPGGRAFEADACRIVPQYKNQFTPAIAGFDALIRWCNGRVPDADAVVRGIRSAGGEIRRQGNRIIYKIPVGSSYYVERVRRLRVQILEILAAEDKSK